MKACGSYALFEARSDPERSLDQLVPNLHQLANQDGSLRAHGLLAICYFYGIGTTPDRDQAETHAALGKSDPNAAFIRAKLAQSPEKPDSAVGQSEVIRLYREAVVLGSPHAPNNLASVLGDSEGTSEQEIRSLLELGVERMELMALYKLSEQIREAGDLSKTLVLLPRAFRDKNYRTIEYSDESGHRFRFQSAFMLANG